MHNVIFLSAGSGNRLRPYTVGIPKCFVKYKNISLIENQFQLFKGMPVANFFIVYGKYYYLYKKLNATLIKNALFAKTNMVYSLYCARDQFKNNLIISYTDINYSNRVIKKLFYQKDHISVVIYKKWENYWKKRSINYLDDTETLKLNKSGYIIDIGNKVLNKKKDVAGQYIGLIKFPKKLIGSIKEELEKLYISKNINNKDFNNAYLTDFLNHLAKIGYKLKPIFINNDWIEIDTVRDYKSMINSLRYKNLNNT